MNESRNLFIGKKGEELAKKFLMKKGYRIVDQNYRTKYAEIDLIASKNGEIIFVEVRTRVGNNFGLPEETINYKKRRKIISNAEAYIHINKLDLSYRVDVICIVLNEDGKLQTINHYENISL